MKIINYLIIILLLCSCNKDKDLRVQNELVSSTEKFEFYSDYWINLHHFLYQQAKQEQLDFITDLKDQAIINNLTKKDEKSYKNALNYYKKKVIDKHLLFSDTLQHIKYWLINEPKDTLRLNSILGSEHNKVLLEFSNTYETFFWDAHNMCNVGKLNENIAHIKRYEQSIFNDLEKLSMKNFPDSILRVDLSVYTTKNSAYTSTHIPNVVITTADDRLKGTHWTELVFHEASHLIMSNRDPISQKMNKISDSLQIKLPRSQWHAIQFYITGKVVQSHFENDSIAHSLYMVDNNVFNRRLTSIFTKQFDLYIYGESNLNKTLIEMINSLNFKKIKL